MKVVILAGGLGTRLSEETTIRPKPMVEIGGRPILWHIMKYYSFYGFNDFVVCLGYKGNLIKDYFINYYTQNSDLMVDLNNNNVTIIRQSKEPFKVLLIDTGLNTNTAGRIKRIKEHTGNGPFLLTYGDGLSNINLFDLINFHVDRKRLVTLSSVQNPGRFGNIHLNSEGIVTSFQEKPEGDNMWVNGGFFVMEQGIFDYLDRSNMDDVQWEKGPLLDIAKDGQLAAYKHSSFWKPMDAMRDKVELEELWNSGNAPWKIW